MSELYDRIVNNRGSFERLIARIPGFRGYQDKQARRKADELLREHLAREIDARLGRLVRIEKLILDNLGMEYMPRTRDVKGKIQLFHDRVATAAPGYSGMWAQMKIGAEELERIYSFDEAQIVSVEKISIALDKLEQAALARSGVEEAIYELDTVASEALEAFSLRDEVLTQLGRDI
ncbi:MAG: hypothetical protein ACOCX3_00750 [Chloroflexota bacterium]